MDEKIKFAALNIDDFLKSNEYYTLKDTSYADVPGVSKICSYQITFFLYF